MEKYWLIIFPYTTISIHIFPLHNPPSDLLDVVIWERFEGARHRTGGRTKI